jgi:predicted nucleotidyltransferase
MAMAEASSDVASVLERALREAAPDGLVSAYLFGSHAEGRAHRESDVDVGILLAWDVHSTAAARFDERLRLTARLAAAHRTDRIDVVVLNDAPPRSGAAS